MCTLSVIMPSLRLNDLSYPVVRTKPRHRSRPRVFRRRLFVAVLLTLTCLASSGPALADGNRLASIHDEIRANYPDVPHVDGEDLQQLMAGRKDLVIFDVREDDEFDVSHLKGAIRIDPGIEGEAFLRQFAGDIAGKTVVFYCSVGRRSSEVAQRVLDVLLRNTGLAAHAFYRVLQAVTQLLEHS